MSITESQRNALEAQGWTASAGLWTAAGLVVLFRRGFEERVETVADDPPAPCRTISLRPINAGGRRGEVTHTTPARANGCPRRKMKVTMQKTKSKAIPQNVLRKLGEMILDDIAKAALKHREIGPKIRAVHQEFNAPLMDCARYFVRCHLKGRAA